MLCDWQHDRLEQDGRWTVKMRKRHPRGGIEAEEKKPWWIDVPSRTSNSFKSPPTGALLLHIRYLKDKEKGRSVREEAQRGNKFTHGIANPRPLLPNFAFCRRVSDLHSPTLNLLSPPPLHIARVLLREAVIIILL